MINLMTFFGNPAPVQDGDLGYCAGVRAFACTFLID